jgi:hypothetical protein
MTNLFVGGGGSVMAARRRRWRRLECKKSYGDNSMRAVTAAAVDDGVGGSRRWSRRGEGGRGGEQCGVECVLH